MQHKGHIWRLWLRPYTSHRYLNIIIVLDTGIHDVCTAALARSDDKAPCIAHLQWSRMWQKNQCGS